MFKVTKSYSYYLFLLISFFSYTKSIGEIPTSLESVEKLYTVSNDNSSTIDKKIDTTTTDEQNSDNNQLDTTTNEESSKDESSILNDISNWFDEKTTFLKQLFINSKQVGAIAPSSSYLAEEMTNVIPEYKEPINILEVGAGTGSFTRKIVEKMPEGSILHVVEIDPIFYNMLKEEFKDNHSVLLYCCDITTLELPHKIDIIISGLPFNAFSPNFVQQILERYKKNFLAKNGLVVFFEYIFFPWFRKINDPENYLGVRNCVEIFKQEGNATESTVFLNLPPARVITCSFLSPQE